MCESENQVYIVNNFAWGGILLSVLITLVNYVLFHFKDTLAQLVHEYKQANKALRHDFLELKKLYVESQEDVQLLRERMRRQSSSSSSHGDEMSEMLTEGKEEYILQLEEYKQQV